jgi:hypothetical protein
MAKPGMEKTGNGKTGNGKTGNGKTGKNGYTWNNWGNHSTLGKPGILKPGQKTGTLETGKENRDTWNMHIQMRKWGLKMGLRNREKWVHLE